METRASYVLIGSFVLLAIGAAFAAVIWLTRVDVDRAKDYYLVYFTESVSGLSLGSTVRYNGIPVGTVTSLDIDPTDPSRVRAMIEVGADTPVRTDTQATLEYQGFTGVTIVQLFGGSAAAPLLTAEAGEGLPVIPSVQSPIQEFFAGGPELIAQVTVLVTELSRLVDAQNRESVTNILSNMETVTGELAAHAPGIERVLGALEHSLVEVESAAAGLDGLVGELNGIAATADGLLDEDARAAILQVNESAASFGRASNELERLLRENHAPLSAFASDGLVEFTKFVEEARLLVGTMSRLMEEIQSDPARFLFGGQRGGFEVERQ